MSNFAKGMVEEALLLLKSEKQRLKKALQQCNTNMERVALIRKTYPYTKAIRISEELGISRERVRQLLTKLNLPTAFEIEPLPSCTKCGIQFSRRLTEHSSGLCKDCFMASKRSIVVCFQCRKAFLMRTKEYINRTQKKGYKHTFCSKQCLGAYAGQHYGFVAHPENISSSWQGKNAD